MNNSLSVVALHIPQLELLDKEPERFWIVFLGAAVLAAAIAYAFYQSRTRLVAEPGSPFSWLPDFPGVEYPPPGSGMVVAHPWPSVDALAVVGFGLLVFAGTCGLAVTRL